MYQKGVYRKLYPVLSVHAMTFFPGQVQESVQEIVPCPESHEIRLFFQ